MGIVRTGFDNTTGSDLFRKGVLREIFDTTDHDVPLYYPKVTNDLKTKKLKETSLRMAGLTAASAAAEGGTLALATPTIGTEKTYTQTGFGLAFRMTHKMDYFNVYDLWARWTKDMKNRMREIKDSQVFTMFNGMTSTSLACSTGYDTLAIASATHTGLASGTADNYDNYIDAVPSQTSIETGRYYFKTLIDDNGNLLMADPDQICFHPALWPDITEFLGSEFKVGTANNELNVVRKIGLTPVELPRLTSSTCWWMAAKKDRRYDFNVFTAMEPIMVIKDAPDYTLDKVALSLQYFQYGWGDPRMIEVGNT